MDEIAPLLIKIRSHLKRNRKGGHIYNDSHIHCIFKQRCYSYSSDSGFIVYLSSAIIVIPAIVDSLYI
jgi:hypothetical protein